jgi:hypothetical protein
MRKLVGFFVFFAFLGIAAAQEQQQGMNQPPKVLVITREFLKPGKSGAPHEKTEMVFTQALARAKEPVHYLGMNSLSGKTRALFVIPFDSFEAWEKDTMWSQGNAALSAALDRANVADGELLESTDQGAFVYSAEYSFHPAVDMPHMRYFEIEAFQIRPGHRAEWDEAVKMVKAAYEKAVPDAHWATYEEILGGRNFFVVFTPMKSLSELDHEMMANKQFMGAMGADGMKKLEELSAASIESSTTNLFAFNAKLSYISEDWIKADPDFWKPKAAPAPAATKKKPEKPAAN